MSPADPHFQAKAPAATHLSAALLRQYAAGTLGAAERRQVEHHTLSCPLCADALEGFQQAAPAAVTPAALAALQQRLHARVAQEPAPATREGAAWWWAAAAAVALLLTFVGIWQWPRPEMPTVARQEVPAPAAPAATPAPSVTPPAAETAATEAARPAVEPVVAAAPSGVRRRRAATRPAVAARRATTDDVAAVQLQDAVTMNSTAEGSAPNTGADVAVALPSEAAPIEAKEELKEEAAVGNVAATSARMAAKKAAAPSAPAASEAAPPATEESSKRKADLPAAPDLAPYPAGGYLAFRSYLQHEQQRPSMGIGGPTHSSGTVKLKFTVEADGAVRNIQVVRGVNPEYDEEAIRLICEGPAWRPAIVNGRRAAQSVRLDVPFH